MDCRSYSVHKRKEHFQLQLPTLVVVEHRTWLVTSLQSTVHAELHSDFCPLSPLSFCKLFFLLWTKFSPYVNGYNSIDFSRNMPVYSLREFVPPYWYFHVFSAVRKSLSRWTDLAERFENGQPLTWSLGGCFVADFSVVVAPIDFPANHQSLMKIWADGRVLRKIIFHCFFEVSFRKHVRKRLSRFFFPPSAFFDQKGHFVFSQKRKIFLEYFLGFNEWTQTSGEINFFNFHFF